MPPQTKTNKEYDTLARAERLTAAIAALEARKSQIESEGEVAPSGCYVARYQARGQRQTYWYYKLQAKKSGVNNLSASLFAINYREQFLKPPQFCPALSW